MKNKWAIVVAVIIVAAAIIIVTSMMGRDSKPAAYSIEDGGLIISCSFGVSVPLDEIEGLTLTETAPEIASRTNGAGIGSMQKGEYRLADGSDARLYADTSLPLFIRFTQGDRVYYLNAENTEATQALYDEITAALG